MKPQALNLGNACAKTGLITVKILFFARLKDLFKKSEISLTIPCGITVKELREKIFNGIEKKEEKWKTLMYAINHEYASCDTKLKDGDEVAFLPFVSGG